MFLLPLTLRYILRTTQCPWKSKKSTRQVLYCNANQFGAETETSKRYRRSLAVVVVRTFAFGACLRDKRSELKIGLVLTEVTSVSKP